MSDIILMCECSIVSGLVEDIIQFYKRVYNLVKDEAAAHLRFLT